MTSAATVSVIVTAYNCQQYIAEALDSILSQTRVPDEIIVVNDGSTDATAEAVAPYLSRGVRYLERPNGGISAARNSGLKVATGAFITFLDCDDRWRPEFVATQVALLESDPSVVCAFANFERFEDATGRVLGDQFQYFPALPKLASEPGPAGTRILTEDAFCAFVAFGEMPCYAQVMMFRAERIAGMRYNETLHLGEDYEFALRVFLKGRVGFIPQVLADIRRHAANTTKDYRYFGVYKLQALKAIAPEVQGDARQRAYLDRLVKAHIDAACIHARRGQIGEGVRVFWSGLGVAGSPRRKLRGAARFLLTVGQWAAGRTS